MNYHQLFTQYNKPTLWLWDIYFWSIYSIFFLNSSNFKIQFSGFKNVSINFSFMYLCLNIEAFKFKTKKKMTENCNNYLNLWSPCCLWYKDYGRRQGVQRHWQYWRRQEDNHRSRSVCEFDEEKQLGLQLTLSNCINSMKPDP